MYNNDLYSSRLQELDMEESSLERYLSENGNTLNSMEIDEVKSRLVGIKTEKQELDELVTGGFY